MKSLVNLSWILSSQLLLPLAPDSRTVRLGLWSWRQWLRLRRASRRRNHCSKISAAVTTATARLRQSGWNQRKQRYEPRLRSPEERAGSTDHTRTAGSSRYPTGIWYWGTWSQRQGGA